MGPLLPVPSVETSRSAAAGYARTPTRTQRLAEPRAARAATGRNGKSWSASLFREAPRVSPRADNAELVSERQRRHPLVQDQASRSLANFLLLILVLDSPIQIFLSPLPTPLVLGSHLPPTWFAFFGSDITGSLLCHLFFSFFSVCLTLFVLSLRSLDVKASS